MSNTDIYMKSFKIVFSKFNIRKAIFIAQIKAFDTLSSIYSCRKKPLRDFNKHYEINCNFINFMYQKIFLKF